jgi:hypothetical protein
LPAGADLAAAFSIPVSAKPAASVRWAIGDGRHKNMQAGENVSKLCLAYQIRIYELYLLIRNLGYLARFVRFSAKFLPFPPN